MMVMIRAGKELTVLHDAQSQVGAKNAERRAIANMGRVIRTTVPFSNFLSTLNRTCSRPTAVSLIK